MEITMSESVNTGTAPDPFNPASLRLDPSYAEIIDVKKLLTTVPVRKPNKHEFVRVHPDGSRRLTPAAIIEIKEEREIYILTPSIANELPGEFVPATLFTTINRQGVLFLWPVKLPGTDGKEMEWHRSSREAAEKAMTSWVRVRANMSLGAYDLHEARGELSEPEWPEFSFPEILRTAFRDRYVDDMDHPLLKRLRGEV
jgi:hypothetical protein